MGLEAQLVGVSATAPGYDFKVLDSMMIFDPARITTPAGQKFRRLAEDARAGFRENGRGRLQARRLEKGLVRNDWASLIEGRPLLPRAS